MKNSIVISCRACGYEKDFYLGVGLYHQGPPDFDSEYALLPRLIRDSADLEAIRTAVEGGAVLETDYRYGLYRCPDCGAFHKCFDYHLVQQDGSVQMPVYHCHCQGTLEKLDLETFSPEAYPCPQCGRSTLTEGFSTLMPDFE